MIWFFRDFIDGGLYVLYIFLCIVGMFALLGVVGDRKRALIEAGLKEKKARDIASGKEAAIAAMESKQVLDVMKDDNANEPVQNQNSNLLNSQSTNQTQEVPTTVVQEVNGGVGGASSTEDLATKKEEAPQVLVIGADGSSNVSTNVEQNQNNQNV